MLGSRVKSALKWGYIGGLYRDDYRACEGGDSEV